MRCCSPKLVVNHTAYGPLTVLRREALGLYRTTNEVVSDAQYEGAAISMLEQCPSDLPYSTTDIS